MFIEHVPLWGMYGHSADCGNNLALGKGRAKGLRAGIWACDSGKFRLPAPGNGILRLIGGLCAPPGIMHGAGEAFGLLGWRTAGIAKVEAAA